VTTAAAGPALRALGIIAPGRVRAGAVAEATVSA
jgi:hypothetical protein